MEIKDLVTVVIPCKNEGINIKHLLNDLNSQYFISGLKVYVSDSSDDISTRIYIDSEINKQCDIEVIDGGLPSIARNNGANLVKTPYVLFLDADMRILNKFMISNLINEIITKKGFLLTCKVRTTNKSFDYVYEVFDVIQRLHRFTGPFALGGIMMFDINEFNKHGGFNDEDVIAEDYNLSRKISSDKFILSKEIILTDDRRFRKKGIWYMLKLMILTFINRNNSEFYKKSFSYWS